MTVALQAKPDTPADIIAWQDEMLRNKQFEEIGSVWSIVFEAAAGGAVPDPHVSNIYGVAMEFPVEQGMTLAQTSDKTTLVMLSPFKDRAGNVGLWDIPDPRWVPPIPKPHEVGDITKKGKTARAMQKTYVPPVCPRIPQELEKRARGLLRGTQYMVFGPVAQILVRPKNIPEGWILKCRADRNGKEMELLVHRTTGEAKFLFGSFEIFRAGNF